MKKFIEWIKSLFKKKAPEEAKEEKAEFAEEIKEEPRPQAVPIVEKPIEEKKLDFEKRSLDELTSDNENQLIIQQIKTVIDPELGVDIWNLELIYDIQIKSEKEVTVFMTFTSPMCPYGPQLVEEVKNSLHALGYETINVEVVIEPPWQPSDNVREMLGIA